MLVFQKDIEVCAHKVAIRFVDVPYKVDEEGHPIEADEINALLEEEGESRAKEMINQNYNGGELNCVIDDTEIRGWWEIIKS